MSIFFRALSAAYITGIFLFADSPMVSDVETFNPYSLLHIPLYGILTFLLLLSIVPYKRRIINPTNSMSPTNPSNSINSSNSSNSMNPTNPMNYFVAGIIALLVAIADEIHQAYLPTRNPSIIDVFLDFSGIILCIALIRLLETKSRFSNIMIQLSRMTQKKGTKHD